MLTTGELVLNTRFQYEALFPDTKPFRVCPIHQPICPNFDPQVHRDVGDLVEAEIVGTVGLLPGLTLMPMYTYTHKFQDHFRGERGFNYGQLQTQTDTDLHTLSCAWPTVRPCSWRSSAFRCRCPSRCGILIASPARTIAWSSARSLILAGTW